MRVRRATVADVDTIVAANIAIARETEDVGLHEDLVRLGVEHALEDDGAGVYYVCEDDGVIGQLLVTREWSDWRNGVYWWIQSVYVAPRARRRGVYRALYAHVVEEARKASVLALKLYVDRDNHVARATYEALGMQRSQYDIYERDLKR